MNLSILNNNPNLECIYKHQANEWVRIKDNKLCNIKGWGNKILRAASHIFIRDNNRAKLLVKHSIKQFCQQLAETPQNIIEKANELALFIPKVKQVCNALGIRRKDLVQEIKQASSKLLIQYLNDQIEIIKNTENKIALTEIDNLNNKLAHLEKYNQSLFINCDLTQVKENLKNAVHQNINNLISCYVNNNPNTPSLDLYKEINKAIGWIPQGLELSEERIKSIFTNLILRLLNGKINALKVEKGPPRVEEIIFVHNALVKLDQDFGTLVDGNLKELINAVYGNIEYVICDLLNKLSSDELEKSLLPSVERAISTLPGHYRPNKTELILIVLNVMTKQLNIEIQQSGGQSILFDTIRNIVENSNLSRIDIEDVEINKKWPLTELERIKNWFLNPLSLELEYSSTIYRPMRYTSSESDNFNSGVHILKGINGNQYVVKLASEEVGMPNNSSIRGEAGIPHIFAANIPGIPLGKGCSREVAAYQIDAGWSRIPPTVMINISVGRGVEIGSAQLFLKNSVSMYNSEARHKIESSTNFKRELRRIAIQDIRMLNGDRHSGNILINDGHLNPIDQGSAFPYNAAWLKFQWMAYSDILSETLEKDELDYIQNINIERDSDILRSLNFQPAAIARNQLATLLLKECIAQGLSLFDVAQILMTGPEYRDYDHMVFNTSIEGKTSYFEAKIMKLYEQENNMWVRRRNEKIIIDKLIEQRKESLRLAVREE